MQSEYKKDWVLSLRKVSRMPALHTKKFQKISGQQKGKLLKWIIASHLSGPGLFIVLKCGRQEGKVDARIPVRLVPTPTTLQTQRLCT